MTKPQLYNVELTEATRNNPQYLQTVVSIYQIPKEKVVKTIDDINMGRKTIVTCVPLDIAKTLTDIFMDACNKNGYSARVNFTLSGKYGD